MSNSPVDVTLETFEQEVIKSDKPVIVDFWAEWCGPCKAISPILEAIADERSDSLKVVKIDVEAQSELASKFMIRSIPTLILFKDGAPDKTHQGSISANDLKKWIDSEG